MFRWIISQSLKFRFLVIAAALGLVVFGVDRLRHVPVDVFPEFAPPLVEVQTEGVGMSAEEVEEFVTIPMEATLRGTAQLEILRSKTVTGLSSVVLLFKQGTDILKARQLVHERLQLAVPSLPASAGRPTMLPALSATSRTMKIGLSSTTVPLTDLSMTAYWTIRMRLLGVPGVANVALWGFHKKQLQVLFDPTVLREKGVTIDKLKEVTAESIDLGLLKYKSSAGIRVEGFLDTPTQRLGIRFALPVVGPQELENIAIATNGRDQTVKLKDVATVAWGSPNLIGDAVVNDGPGILMIVEKFPWANTLDVTHGVEATLEKLRPGLPGIEIDHTIFRPATFIEQSIENLVHALLIGSLLVVAVLAAFLFEWRVALISIIAIPLSLVAGGLVLYLQGATVNVMVVAGFVVALGSIVDDAIIDVENIMRRLREARLAGSARSTFDIILEASLEIRSAIVFATLIIVLSVTPVIFLTGLAGSFFAPLALAYALALLASMIVALTVTPALALILLDGTRATRGQPPLVAYLQRSYVGMLEGVMARPKATYGAVLVVTIAGIAIWPNLGKILLPSFKERDFLMHWVIKPGASHDEMFRMTQRASRELRSIPGVRNFGAHIGRAEAGDEVYGINFTENWISVDRDADYDRTLAALQSMVDGYPGIYRDVQTYLKERIKEVLTGTSESIVIRIFGPDLLELRRLADEVRQALGDIPGLVDLNTELLVEQPQIQVRVDLAAAARHGLKPGDVRRASAAVMAGLEVSDILKGGKVFDVFVWAAADKRASLTDVENMLLDTPDGGTVRLREVAEVKVGPTPNHIKREDFSRRIDVGANVRGRDLGSVAAEVEARVAQIKFPLGYYPQVLGEDVERRAAQKQLALVAAFAVAGIFLLLQMAFGSWRLAAVAFLTLPAALIGGILATQAGNGIISLGSLVGFLTVLGIAARNSILLIHHCHHLEHVEGEPFGWNLVVRGARERLSPILMTSLCTGLALLPLLVNGDLPGHEIEHPMAVVIVGGLISSTLLSLFLVPVLYLRFSAPAVVRPERA